MHRKLVNELALQALVDIFMQILLKYHIKYRLDHLSMMITQQVSL